MLIIEHKCEAVRRGLTETWDCRKAAELLHMAVPVSVMAEPRHWACALLCIASYGWQRDHKVDGWNRYAGLALLPFASIYLHTCLFLSISIFSHILWFVLCCALPAMGGRGATR